MKTPKVSIVIPNRNCENEIERSINSARNQTLRDIEIICVDDFSSDSSREIITRLAKQDDRIISLFYDGNKSQSQARKDGVKLAKGEYILFLDSDDYLNEDACEYLYQLAQKDKSIDIICFDTEVHIVNNKIDKKRSENLQRWLNSSSKDLYIEREIIDGAFGKGNFPFTLWNKLYKADVAKAGFKNIKDGFFPKGQDAYAFLP